MGGTGDVEADCVSAAAAVEAGSTASKVKTAREPAPGHPTPSWITETRRPNSE